MEISDLPVYTNYEFNQGEKEKIIQLRQRISPMFWTEEQKSDTFLAKWLIARNFDLDKAEEMLKKHLRFVRLHKLENNVENYKPPEAVNYFYTARLGYDKEGSIIRLLHVGASDLKGLCCCISKEESIRHASYLIKNDMIEQKEKWGNIPYSDKQVYILDLQGLSWRTVIQRIVVERAVMLLRCYEANHPECLKVAYLINVPSFFSFIYNWLKTVLPEAIISKLEIISLEDVPSVLTKKVDPKILPASMGGLRTDPDGDPQCNSLFVKPLGTPVPESLMPTYDLELLKNDPEARKIMVEYRSSFIVQKEVKEANSFLDWDFQTTDYDIRIGLQYRQNENSEPEVIIPLHRVDSHIMPESGHVSCENPGIYELVFDNTYSWMTRKEVIFKINWIPPKDIDN